MPSQVVAIRMPLSMIIKLNIASQKLNISRNKLLKAGADMVLELTRRGYMPIVYRCRNCGYEVYRFISRSGDSFGIPTPSELKIRVTDRCPACGRELRPRAPTINDIIIKRAENPPPKPKKTRKRKDDKPRIHIPDEPDDIEVEVIG